MLPAEIQRIVLLIGLAATGYLLILAWNEDAQEARTTDYYSAEPEIAGIESARNAIPTERSQPTDAVNDDIPAMPLPSNNVQPQSTTTEPYSADRLITVTTSSIKMWIDLEGGDVVRVLLPKFPVQIDDPDIPFVLLDQGQQRIYVAQSGLIGADGTDSNGERPLFSSERTSYVLDQDELEVVLRADVAGNPVEKIFRFRADDYLVDVEYRVVNNKTSPFEAGMFAQIKRDRLPPTLQESFFLRHNRSTAVPPLP